MNYLLDTCLVSELTKPRPDTAVVAWVSQRDERSLYLSVLTLGELHRGIQKLPPSEKKARLQHWVANDLVDRFADRILAITTQVAEQWGGLVAAAEGRGEPLPAIDSLIAATALTHDLTVVTRDADIVRCGARVLNPWEQSIPP